MLKCGLLGKSLKHSFSPEIHAGLASYEYLLYERQETELKAFLKSGDFRGLNVTIPYKKTVVPYLDDLSKTAKRIGSVNTVIKAKDGSLYGDNTDYYGFIDLLNYEGISVKGKKVLVLGNGGAAAAVTAAIEDLGGCFVVISRRGENNYKNISAHFDADVIVNTTPVGMFPNNGEQPLTLTSFTKLQSVVDIIYNPLRTALLLEGERLHLKTANGLYMLVSQARRAAELFTDSKIDDKKTEEVYKALNAKMQNIVLIGMPGCGKSSIAKELCSITKKQVIDTDTVIEERIKMPISEYFAKYGESEFRKVEAGVISDVSKQSGVIISTGGGCVTVPQNYNALHQNGVIVWIKRDIESLSREGRPLSLGADLDNMYKVRKPLYKEFADVCIYNNLTVTEAAEKILEVLV